MPRRSRPTTATLASAPTSTPSSSSATGEPLAEELDGVEVGADASVAVVGRDLLGLGHRRQRRTQGALGVIGQAQGRAVGIGIGQGGAQLPEELATRCSGPVEGTNADEPLDHLLTESRPRHEIADILVRAAL